MHHHAVRSTRPIPADTNAVIASLIIGLLLLSGLSYYIALYHNANPAQEIIEHLGIALMVLIASNFLGKAITGFFGG
ncbi:MAG: hypothetical protein WAX07_01045 [Candidatus Altiarchaeia archaeon]